MKSKAKQQKRDWVKNQMRGDNRQKAGGGKGKFKEIEMAGGGGFRKGIDEKERIE